MLPSTQKIEKEACGATSAEGRCPLQRLKQVDARLFPVALHGPFGYALHAGDLDEGEPAEELEVHDDREPRVDCRQLVERVADPRQLFAVRQRVGELGRERRELEQPSALLRMPAAR